MQASSIHTPPHVDASIVAPGIDILRRLSANTHKRWGDRYEEFGPLAAVTRLAQSPIPDIRISPKFTIPKTARVFAIGSCFARHIEICLQKNGVQVLSRRYEGIPQDVCETNPSQTLNSTTLPAFSISS